jgi:hypothetical protein
MPDKWNLSSHIKVIDLKNMEFHWEVLGRFVKTRPKWLKC